MRTDYRKTEHVLKMKIFKGASVDNSCLTFTGCNQKVNVVFISGISNQYQEVSICCFFDNFNAFFITRRGECDSEITEIH